jgi:hypothetical protein
MLREVVQPTLCLYARDGSSKSSGWYARMTVAVTDN